MRSSSSFFIANLPSINVDAQTTPEGGELLKFIASEQQRGSVLTYSQSYVDDQNERVSYNGTLYAGIHLFKLDECKVTARVAIEDRYSGAIEHRSLGRVRLEHTGELKDDTVYEYRFNLGDLSADGVHALRAIPAQLNINTRVQCEEDRSCTLPGFKSQRRIRKLPKPARSTASRTLTRERSRWCYRWRHPSWPTRRRSSSMRRFVPVL